MRDKQKQSLKSMRYAKRHPDVHLKTSRRTKLSQNKIINGKKVTYQICGLHKRPYPNYCEMCGRFKEKRLSYHHWTDSNYNWGIWVCKRCHDYLEDIDSGRLKTFMEKYAKLKIEIEKSP